MPLAKKESDLIQFLELEKATECSLCKEYFDDDYRLPKNLTCGHHFCYRCLKRLPRFKDELSSSRRYISCPNCRKRTKLTITKHDYWDFPTNYAILSLTEKLKSHLENEGSDVEDEASYCECGEHFEEGNFNFCESCDLAVCDRCAWKKHKVHFNDVCDHETFFKKLRERVESHSKRGGKILVSLRSELDETRKRFSFFTEHAKAVSDSVKQLFEFLRSALNEQEENLLSVIKNHEKEKLALISEREGVLKEEVIRLQEALSFKEEIVDINDDIELIPMRSVIRNRLEKLSKFELVHIPALVCPQKLRFTQSQSVIGMIKEVPVGNIEFDAKPELLQGIANVAAVSLQIGYPTVASVPHSLISGFRVAESSLS